MGKTNAMGNTSDGQYQRDWQYTNDGHYQRYAIPTMCNTNTMGNTNKILTAGNTNAMGNTHDKQY